MKNVTLLSLLADNLNGMSVINVMASGGLVYPRKVIAFKYSYKEGLDKLKQLELETLGGSKNLQMG